MDSQFLTVWPEAMRFPGSAFRTGGRAAGCRAMVSRPQHGVLTPQPLGANLCSLYPLVCLCERCSGMSGYPAVRGLSPRTQGELQKLGGPGTCQGQPTARGIFSSHTAARSVRNPQCLRVGRTAASRSVRPEASHTCR